MRRKSRGLSFYKKRKKISATALKEIFTWIFGIAVSVLLAFVLVLSVGMKTRVIGVSMEPALYNGQQILINRFLYTISSPKRGDVVVFLPNGNKNSHYYVKRVIAVPGETVQIKEGRVFVNGVLLEEEFDKIADAGIAENEIRLGSEEYFVMGDNRNSSEDSRSGNIGAVRKELIEGRAWFKMASGDSKLGIIK